MRRWLVIGFIMVTSSVSLYGQVDTLGKTPIFFEREAGDMIRLFYDDRYFLVDKYCEFKAIERVGRYDFQQRVFTGEFTDLDNAGRVILEGRYVDGRKDGDFNAYHPNGQLKWQASYIRGTVQGPLNFFYPDGKPLLELVFSGEDARILNFWDRRGRQRVTDGHGRYAFSILADGYNEFGYIRYNRKGKVVDGYPHGNWSIEYVFADGKERKAGYELYNKGRLVHGYDAYLDESYYNRPRYHLLPIDFSNGAEAMIGKACTIDDHIGFTGYLAEYLSEWFDGMVETPADPVAIAFTVAVKATGEPGRIEMKSTFETQQHADLLLEAIQGVGFWQPSFGAGEYIEDTLTVTTEAFLDMDENKVRFYEVKIKREKGI